jgi:hypothetical protein
MSGFCALPTLGFAVPQPALGATGKLPPPPEPPPTPPEPPSPDVLLVEVEPPAPPLLVDEVPVVPVVPKPVLFEFDVLVTAAPPAVVLEPLVELLLLVVVVSVVVVSVVVVLVPAVVSVSAGLPGASALSEQAGARSSSHAAAERIERRDLVQCMSDAPVRGTRTRSRPVALIFFRGILAGERAIRGAALSNSRQDPA